MLSAGRERMNSATVVPPLVICIVSNSFGIDNLDYKYLAADLVENEPELFK